MNYQCHYYLHQWMSHVQIIKWAHCQRQVAFFSFGRLSEISSGDGPSFFFLNVLGASTQIFNGCLLKSVYPIPSLCLCIVKINDFCQVLMTWLRLHVPMFSVCKWAHLHNHPKSQKGSYRIINYAYCYQIIFMPMALTEILSAFGIIELKNFSARFWFPWDQFFLVGS